MVNVVLLNLTPSSTQLLLIELIITLQIIYKFDVYVFKYVMNLIIRTLQITYKFDVSRFHVGWIMGGNIQGFRYIIPKASMHGFMTLHDADCFLDH